MIEYKDVPESLKRLSQLKAKSLDDILCQMLSDVMNGLHLETIGSLYGLKRNRKFIFFKESEIAYKTRILNSMTRMMNDMKIQSDNRNNRENKKP